MDQLTYYILMKKTVDAAEKTMGIVNDATSHVTEKASDEDVAGLQAYIV